MLRALIVVVCAALGALSAARADPAGFCRIDGKQYCEVANKTPLPPYRPSAAVPFTGNGDGAIPLASKASRYAWPALGMDKTIALGEALAKTPHSRVIIWCPGTDCTELQADLDDAFQIAGWTTDWDRRRVDSNDEVGLFVGPPDEHAQALADAIEATTGLRVTVTDAPRFDATINLYIGKRPH